MNRASEEFGAFFFITAHTHPHTTVGSYDYRDGYTQVQDGKIAYPGSSIF
jgi:hypothetical protein